MTLVVLGCKGDYNTLRYQKNKRRNTSTKIKGPVSIQPNLYVYIYVHISLDVSFDNNCGK